MSTNCFFHNQIAHIASSPITTTTTSKQQQPAALKSKTMKQATTTTNNNIPSSSRKRKGYENRDEQQLLKKKQKNHSNNNTTRNNFENLFTQDQENYLFGTNLGGRFPNYSAQDNYSFHCFPSPQQQQTQSQQHQQQLPQDDQVDTTNSNFFDIFDEQNGQHALLEDFNTGNMYGEQKKQPRGMFFDYFCNMDNDEYYPLDPFMTEEVISTVPGGIDNGSNNTTGTTGSFLSCDPHTDYDSFSPSVMESRIPLCTLPSVFDESPDEVDAEDEFLHPSQHELDVRILRSDDKEDDEDQEDLDTATSSTPSDTSSVSSLSEDEEMIDFLPRADMSKIQVEEDTHYKKHSETITTDLSAALETENAPSSDLEDHTASEDDEDSDYTPESTTLGSKSSSTRRCTLQEPKNTSSAAPRPVDRQTDYDHVLNSLMNSDSMPSPYKKELTPAERNAIITEEMMQLTGSNQSHKLMILSPERNRHKTFDIPRKDITSRNESQDPTLKIGSGSEKKFKYFLHVLFKTKQANVPKLELIKEDDASEIPKALKIHQASLIEGGMMARYSMSFLINSFEHERKSFQLVVKDPQTSNILVKSVPFKLNARKTSDCLFHMKAASPPKKKSARKN